MVQLIVPSMYMPMKSMQVMIFSSCLQLVLWGHLPVPLNDELGTVLELEHH